MFTYSQFAISFFKSVYIMLKFRNLRNKMWKDIDKQTFIKL